MECQKCGRIVENVGELTTKVTCSYCVLRAVGFPEEPKGYVPTGRPMGWHWMKEFVDKDGNVFHKGKEQPKLKGTLKPTVVNRKKLNAEQKSRYLLIDIIRKKWLLEKRLRNRRISLIINLVDNE